MFHKQYRQHNYSGIITNDTCDRKVSCCFAKNKVVPLNTIKTYEWAYVFCHSFLISALDIGELSTSCLGHLPHPRDRIPGTQQNRRLGVPHSLYICSRKELNILFPLRIKSQFFSCPAQSLVTISTTLPSIPFHTKKS